MPSPLSRHTRATRQMQSGLAAVSFMMLPLASPPARPRGNALLQEMAERFETQSRSVGSFVVVTERFTAYHECAGADEQPGCAMHIAWHEEVPSGSPDVMTYQAYREQFWQMASEARPAGTARIGTTRAHVFEAEASAFAPPDAALLGGDGTVRLYIDAARGLPLGLDFDVVAGRGSGRGGGRGSGRARALRTTVRFHDHRTADGLTVPFRTEMIVRPMNVPSAQDAAADSMLLRAVVRVCSVHVGAFPHTLGPEA